jgi:uncharacterized protein (DUF305 family)
MRDVLRVRGPAAVAALAVVIGCARSGDAPRVDSARVDAEARGDSASADSAVVDPDQQLLRIMADHHAGLIALARTAAERAADSTSRGTARRLADRLDGEQAEMLELLRAGYGDPHRAMALPVAKAADDSLRQAAPEEAGRLFRESALSHLQSDLAVIDRYVPSLTREDVATLARRVSAAHERAVAELEPGVATP